ncbi:hypothetical protein RSAG8_08401, partial [Rhizoctonia solani AG-8 WAC10335]
MTRVAIITNAAQGIGEAIAYKLSSDGIDVALADLPNKRHALEQVVKTIQGSGRKAIPIICDISKGNEVQDMVKKAVVLFGGLDVMVANAGTMGYSSILERRTILLPGCGDSNDQTRARLKGAMNSAGYCVSKFGVRALTQTAALEWGQYDITVNAYAPGYIDTPMITETGGGSHGENFLPLLRNSGLERMGEPEEIAAVVVFLALEGASYVTGESTLARTIAQSFVLMGHLKDNRWVQMEVTCSVSWCYVYHGRQRNNTRAALTGATGGYGR